MNAAATIALAAGLASAAASANAAWVFTRIADQTTPVPSGTGTFQVFKPPAVSNGKAIFAATAKNAGGVTQEGVFTDVTGSLANRSYNFTLPNSSSVLNYPSLDGPNTVYTERLNGGGGGGWNLVRTVAAPTQIVGIGSSWTPSALSSMGMPTRSSVSGNRVAYGGTRSIAGWESPTLGGIFSAASNTILQVVSKNVTPVPNAAGQNFSITENPRIWGSGIVFNGTGNAGREGIYSVPALGGAVTRIVDQTTPVPASTGTFNSFYAPSFDGANIAFTARLSGVGFPTRAIFRTSGATLSKIGDSGTSLLGLTGPKTYGDEPSIIGATTIFAANDNSGAYGLYLHSITSGAFTRIIGSGDPLDGRTVKQIYITRDAFDGQYIGIKAVFTNGTEGNYITRVPAPAAVALLGASAVFAARRRRTI